LLNSLRAQLIHKLLQFRVQGWPEPGCTEIKTPSDRPSSGVVPARIGGVRNGDDPSAKCPARLEHDIVLDAARFEQRGRIQAAQTSASDGDACCLHVVAFTVMATARITYGKGLELAGMAVGTYAMTFLTNRAVRYIPRPKTE